MQLIAASAELWSPTSTATAAADLGLLKNALPAAAVTTCVAAASAAAQQWDRAAVFLKDLG